MDIYMLTPHDFDIWYFQSNREEHINKQIRTDFALLKRRFSFHFTGTEQLTYKIDYADTKYTIMHKIDYAYEMQIQNYADTNIAGSFVSATMKLEESHFCTAWLQADST